MNQFTLSISELTAHLAATELFRRLDRKVLEEIAVDLELINLSKGEALFRQGDVSDAMYVVINGGLQAAIAQENGDARVVSEVGPGELVGEIAILTGGMRTASLYAVSDTALLRLSKTTFDRLAAQDVQTRAQIDQIILQRLRRDKLAARLFDLFGPLDKAALQQVEAEIEWIDLPRGEALVRQGEAGDRLYILISGRLRVVVADERGAERVVSDVAPGESVGEMGILTGETRSSSVYAIRDSVLVKLSQAGFERLLEKQPQLLRHIAQLVTQRLRRATPATPARKAVTNLAIISAGLSVPLAEFARRLVAALSANDATLHLSSARIDQTFQASGLAQTAADSPTNIRLSAWLDAQESQYRFVIYEADPSVSPWTRRCLRQADQILVVGQAGAAPTSGEIEAERLGRGRDPITARRILILLHPDAHQPPAGTHQWLAVCPVDMHHHLRWDEEADFQRLARFVAGRAVGLALGGGGARGLAHIGVLRALTEAGIPIDAIGGASMGAIIAAEYALGWDYQTLLNKNRAHSGATQAYDLTIPFISLLAGRRKAQYLAQCLGNTAIEDLWLPFFCVSSNLTRAELMIHRTGSLRRGVLASTALPGIMPPIVDKGDLLVDGGLMNNVPMDIMRDLCGSGTVITVDVSTAVDLAGNPQLGDYLSGWQVLWHKINPFATPFRVPNIAMILRRAVELGGEQHRIDLIRQGAADLYLRPPIEKFGLFDFKSIDQIVEVGYRFAREKIAEWPPGRSLGRRCTMSQPLLEPHSAARGRNQS